MGFPKAILVSFLLSLLFLQLVHAQLGAGGVNKIDCGVACGARCSETKRPNLCKRACGACCAKCNCVPPGTSGNYDTCPCYASLTTHGNRKKCP